MRVQVVEHLMVIPGQLVVVAREVLLLVLRQQAEVRELLVHHLHRTTQTRIVSLEEFLGFLVLHRLYIHDLIVVTQL